MKVPSSKGVALSVVCSSSINDFDLIEKKLSQIIKVFVTNEISTQGTTEADKMVLSFAKENNIKHSVLHPEWASGKMDDFEKNRRTVEKSEMIVAFWDGESKGTEEVIEIARKMCKTIFVIEVTQ